MRVFKKGISKMQLVLWIVLFIQLGIVVFMGFEKQGFHYDEYYSYYAANGTAGTRFMSDRSYNDVKYLTEDFSVQPGEKFQFKEIMAGQQYDTHPPLHYLLLNTVSSFFENTFSKWEGLSINIAAYLITFFALYGILKILTKGIKWAAVIGCGLIGINPGVLSTVMYVRMYMLCTMFVMLLLYMHLHAMQKGKLTLIMALCIGLVMFGGALTQYSFFAFALLSAFGFCVYMLFFKKRVWDIILYIIVNIAAVLSYLKVWPYIKTQLFNNNSTGNAALQNLFDLQELKIKSIYFLKLLNWNVFDDLGIFILGLIGVLSIILVFLCIRYKKKEVKELGVIFSYFFLYTIGISLIYFIALIKTGIMMDISVFRYITPAYYLILICLFIIIYALADSIKSMKKQIILIPLLCLIFLLINIKGICDKRVYFLYPETKDRLEVLDKYKNDELLFLCSTTFSWALWDDTREIMQFKSLYYMFSDNLAPIDNTNMDTCGEMIVYMDKAITNPLEECANMIKESNPSLDEYELLYETIYYRVYRFY